MIFSCCCWCANKRCINLTTGMEKNCVAQRLLTQLEIDLCVVREPNRKKKNDELSSIRVDKNVCRSKIHNDIICYTFMLIKSIEKKYEDFISLEQEKTSADKPNRDITNNCFETKIKLYTTTWHTQWINKSNEQTTIEEWKTQKSPMNHATNDKQNNNTLCRADTSTLHTRTQVLRTMSTDSQWFLLSL